MAQTVSVRLSEESLREVDRLAERLNTDRSEALRRLIERGLREARIDDAIDRLRRGRSPLVVPRRWRGSRSMRCSTSSGSIASRPDTVPRIWRGTYATWDGDDRRGREIIAVGGKPSQR